MKCQHDGRANKLIMSDSADHYLSTVHISPKFTRLQDFNTNSGGLLRLGAVEVVMTEVKSQHDTTFKL